MRVRREPSTLRMVFEVTNGPHKYVVLAGSPEAFAAHAKKVKAKLAEALQDLLNLDLQHDDKTCDWKEPGNLCLCGLAYAVDQANKALAE